MPEVERSKFRKDAKPTERSFKGKGVGGFRGIIVFLQWLWEWQYSVQRKAIPPVVARIFSGDSTSPLTREARVMAVFVG